MRRERGPRCHALGRSRGGFSTKIHALVDTRGQPLYVTLTAGQQHDSTVAEDLIARAGAKACIADAGYDADRIIAAIRSRGMRAVIANGSGRKKRRRVDRQLYGIRYRIECFFHRLKRCRRIATRYEKTARNYLALVHLACALMWLA